MNTRTPLVAFSATLLTVVTALAPGWSASLPAGAASTPIDERQKVIHLLDRLTFGPRPGDVELVQRMGAGAWLQQQLAPASLDDSAVEAKLATLPTLKMAPDRLLLAYAADTAGFLKKMQKQKQQERQAQRQQQAVDVFFGDKPKPAAQPEPAALHLNPQQQQLMDRVQNSGIPYGTSVQAVGELVTDKIVRACESNRQLQEVLVDFWGNHFNLDVHKGIVRTMKIVDDREVIRPHVLGKFRDLLGASAKSPAMLFYLDNVRSTRENAPRLRNRKGIRIKGDNKARGGVNENYARELMELHTLGVDGGYTQKDVQEVARCFTGWTINRETGGFRFVQLLHDTGSKTVLGQTIPAGRGIEDGEQVLDILASDPHCAHFISRELCQRLVADNPPAALVDAAAATFRNTGGDLKAVTTTIVLSPLFYTHGVYHAKVKSPFEFAVSAVRALGGRVTVPDPSVQRDRVQLMAAGGASALNGGARYDRRQRLAEEIAAMGQPLFGCQPPTGYTEDSSRWVSTGALIARLNFALSLTSGQVHDVVASPRSLVRDVPPEQHEAVLDRLVDVLLCGEVSVGTRATLQKQLRPETPTDPTRIAALVLGSPEFQRR